MVFLGDKKSLCTGSKVLSRTAKDQSAVDGRFQSCSVSLNITLQFVIVICFNSFTHGAFGSSLKELFEMFPCVPDRVGIWKCWLLRRGENRSTQRKTSRSKGENQQQTQPTYGVDARIRTGATLVGGQSALTTAPF